MPFPAMHTLIRERGVRDVVTPCKSCGTRSIFEIEIVKVAVNGEEAQEFMRVCSWCDVQVEKRQQM